MDNKKVFMFLIMGIFLISTASATFLDYDDQTRTATLSNQFLFWETGTIATAQLLTPLDYKVGLGEQYVWEMKVIGFDDYQDFISGMDFYDRKNGMAKFNRDYDLRKKEIIQISVDDYSMKCEYNETIGDESCYSIIIGNHYEDKEIWTKLKQVDFKKNDVLFIRMYVFVEVGDKVEWIPTIAKQEIPQWAGWIADLNVDLEMYLKLDNNILTDPVNSNDATNFGTTNTSGQIKSAREFIRTESDYMSVADNSGLDINTGDFSILFWINPDEWTSTGLTVGVLGKKENDGSVGWQIWRNSGVNFLYFRMKDASHQEDSVSTFTLTEGTPQHIIISYDNGANTVTFFKDGVFSNTISSRVFGDLSNSRPMIIGRAETWTPSYFDGWLDEIEIYSKTFNNAEANYTWFIQKDGFASGQYTDNFGSNPIVTAISPADNTEYTTSPQSIDFTCYGSDDVDFTDMEFYLNGSLTQTNSSGINNTNYIFTESLTDGDYNWSCIGYDDEANSEESEVRYLTIDTTPFIEFLTPPTLVDYANISQEYIPMKVDVSTIYFENITYSLRNENSTNYTQFYTNQTYDINFTDMPDAHYHYDVTICTTTDQCNSTETRHVFHHATLPVLSSAYNLTDLLTQTLPINSTWHYNASDPVIDSCYYNTTEDPTYKIITCNSTENTEWATSGNKTIQFCANDTFGNEACSTDSIWVFEYSQTDDPDPSVEGFDTTFILNLSTVDIPTVSATFNINGSIYSATETLTQNNSIFTMVLNIPSTFGNATGVLHDWYWNLSGNFTGDTATENITIYELAIDDCSSYGDLILNFSLNNEETNLPVNESAGSNIEVDLTLTSKTNSSVSLTYSNMWADENNPQVCLPNNVLNNSQYWLDLTVGFDSTDHVWEFYYIDDGTLNSSKILQDFNGQTTTNISLMDLETADSTSFLFNYFDTDGLAVVDAIVHPMRKYIGDGQFLEIERSKADQNGDTIVHLVEEDVIYFFYITQYGVLLHTSSTYTALCQTTPCTIQIEASGEGAVFDTNWDLIDGGGYLISSNSATRQVNLTYLVEDASTFNFTLYKYENDGSYSVVNATTETGTSGTLLLTVPQSAGNVSFFASVIVNEEFINSEWVNFEQRSSDFIGVTLALFLGALIILTLGLLAVSEGVGTLVYVILGVVIVGALGLVRTELSTGLNVVIYLVSAGGILLWKLTGGRK